MRALLKYPDGGTPLPDRVVRFRLVDPHDGFILGTREMRTTEYGLAWARFPLDAELPSRKYQIVADSEGASTTARFLVDHYRLPAYEIDVRPEEGSASSGVITARTFDGHAVRGLRARFEIEGNAMEVALDDQGAARYDLPADATKIDVTVTDPAGQTATKTVRLRARRGEISWFVLPESGELVAGLENRVYVVGRRDGKPLTGDVECRLDDLRGTVALDDDGVGVWKLVPPATSKAGAIGVRQGDGTWDAHDVGIRAGVEGGLLVRADRAIARAGGEVSVSLVSAREDGVVAVALRRDGRTLALRTVELDDGRATVKLGVPARLAGDVVLEATHFHDEGASMDRKVLLVPGGFDLRVSVSSDRPRYRPGERARLDVAVVDAEGRGVPAGGVAGGRGCRADRARGQEPRSRAGAARVRAALADAVGLPGEAGRPSTRRRSRAPWSTRRSLRCATARRRTSSASSRTSFRATRWCERLWEEIEWVLRSGSGASSRRTREAFLAALSEQGHEDTAAVLARVRRDRRSGGARAGPIARRSRARSRRSVGPAGRTGSPRRSPHSCFCSPRRESRARRGGAPAGDSRSFRFSPSSSVS